MEGTSIDRLSIEIESNAQKSLTALNNLANKLEKLKSATTGGMTNLTRTNNSLRKIATTMNQFKNVSEFGKGINAFVRGIKKLKEAEIGDLDEKINAITKAIKPLTDEMIRAGSGITNFGEQMKYLTQATKTANTIKKDTQKVSSGYNSLAKSLNFGVIVGKATLAWQALRTGASKLASSINNINSYIENLNLFTVAMKDFSEEGLEFTQRMQDILGIDAGEAMRNMGIFMQMVSAFGLASDQAYVLSKNLTQLGYDLSSFYNIKTEDAFLKLQSGIAGKLICLICKGLHIVTYLIQWNSKRIMA